MARRKSKSSGRGARGAGRKASGGGGLQWVILLAVLIGIGWWWFRRVRSSESDRTPAPAEPARRGSNPVVTVPPARQPPATNAAPVKPEPLPPEPPVVIRPTATNPPANRILTEAPAVTRPVTNILEAQIALTWHGISCGPIDGRGGGQTELGLRAFQLQHRLDPSGRLDRETLRELVVDRPRYRRRVLSESDLAGLAPTPDTWLAKSQAQRLDHETLPERLGEEAQAHPDLIRELNPGVDWSATAVGTEVTLPNASYPPARRANLVRVNLAQKWIRAFDGNGRMLCHFPCSIGRIAEKRPVGELAVAVAVKDPNYTFNPAVFPESEEGRALGRKLVIPPGPNNPVGVAWIGLSKAGYGIHGTPGPEKVGRTESHGCFRLANWNADYLRQIVRVGTPVWIE